MGKKMLELLEKQYSPSDKIHLGYYAGLTLIFNSLLIGATAISSRRLNRNRNAQIKLRDWVIAGIAIHKLARIITKDAVTGFIRAPFTRYQEPLGYGEVSETPRRSGGLEVVGELLSCNYCMSAWVGLGFFWGLSVIPVQTRLLAGFFSSLALSDFLHVAYEEKRTHSNVLTLREEKMDRKPQAS